MVQPLEWLLVTLQIYRHVWARAAALALKNWPVFGSLVVYHLIWTVAATVCLPLGIAGGFVLTIVKAACLGSFLYLVEMIVRTSKVTLEDFRRSFGTYLWDVVGITFVFWIFFRLATPAIAQLPQGFLILLFVEIAGFVVFNAVPELIYLGHYSSLALLSESYAFIAANWIEWFPANLVAAGILYAVAAVPLNGLAVYVQTGVLGLLVYFTMVMRGLLFVELHGSTQRSRAFKYRMDKNGA